MSNPTKERICGVIPLHGGYPCYLPEGHETYHSDGHTTWPTMDHKIAPDPHALLRDKLREMCPKWVKAGCSMSSADCARELSALIEGAK